MNKTKYQIFPTLITKYEGILLPNEIELLHKFCLNFDSSFHGSITKESKSSHNLENKVYDIFDVIEKTIPNFFGIKSRITTILNDYANEFRINSVKIENSWFNVQSKGSILKQHCHPFSTISAALYLNVDANSSKIFFENPNQHIHYCYDEKETSKSKYLFGHYYVTPSPGDLIVFPSWLKHGSMYEENQTENRTVISMNALRQ